jgi:hypothetical protein
MRPPQMNCRDLVEAMHGIETAFAPAGNATRICGQITAVPRSAASPWFSVLDQSTVANMTAALEYICKQIPPKNDNHETRKAIADAMLAGAKAGARSLPQLQEIGSAKLKEIVSPSKRGWLWWKWKR